MIDRARASSLFVVAALGLACGPAAAPEVDPASVTLELLCQKRCACEECRREERGVCTTDATNAPALARRSHCDAPLDAWVHCQETMAACLGGRFVDQGCESQRKALDACLGR